MRVRSECLLAMPKPGQEEATILRQVNNKNKHRHNLRTFENEASSGPAQRRGKEEDVFERLSLLFQAASAACPQHQRLRDSAGSCQQSAGREKWRAHLERAEEKPSLGGRGGGGVALGSKHPASSPSSQQRGKLWLTRPETQRKEGPAPALSPSVLIPLSCFPQGGGQNRCTP